ncbi:hypothetical protein J6590_025071 [Homalodisca vitripennis]|nr:hypothetical protein J6590_025071 [Homalodisca vitripennis]
MVETTFTRYSRCGPRWTRHHYRAARTVPLSICVTISDSLRHRHRPAPPRPRFDRFSLSGRVFEARWNCVTHEREKRFQPGRVDAAGPKWVECQSHSPFEYLLSFLVQGRQKVRPVPPRIAVPTGHCNPAVVRSL